MYFALTQNQRHSLNADTEQKARFIADNILKLSGYQIQTHAEYWASGRGKAELAQQKKDDVVGKVKRHERALIRSIAPVDPDTLDLLWPMLNQASASPQILRIRAIQAYAKNLKPGDDYEPSQDGNWP